MPSPPAAGSISFVTPQIGWMLGGPGGDKLWATDNGGMSWQERYTAVPENAKGCQRKYDQLAFSEVKEGILTASVDCLDHSYVIDYASHNGGQSWQINSLVEEESASRGGAISTISGTHAIHVLMFPKNIVMIQMPEGTSSPTLPPEMWPNGSVTRAVFVNNNYGWLLYTSGQCAEFKSKCSQQSELLSTTDGGNTLVRITPEILVNLNTRLSSTGLNNKQPSESQIGGRRVLTQPRESVRSTRRKPSHVFDSYCK